MFNNDDWDTGLACMSPGAGTMVPGCIRSDIGIIASTDLWGAGDSDEELPPHDSQGNIFHDHQPETSQHTGMSWSGSWKTSSYQDVLKSGSAPEVQIHFHRWTVQVSDN